MKLTLKLETDYTKYGNDTDMQIDTLARAICGSTLNEIEEDSLEYIDESENYVRREYDHTDDFIATLTKAKRAHYAKDLPAYEEALAAYTEDIQEKQSSYELDESHPYAKATQEARDSAQDELRHTVINGDYHDAGILSDAARKINVESVDYDEKKDEISIDLTDENIEEAKESLGFTDMTANELKDHYEEVI